MRKSLMFGGNLAVQGWFNGSLSSGFTPLDLGAKLQFWFDNDDASKVTTSAGNVTSQTDQTGAYTRTVASPAANPPYVTSSIIDSKKYISYRGSQGLKLSANGFNHSQGEMFIVFRRYLTTSVGLTNNNILVSNTQQAVGNRFALLQDYANTSSLGNSVGFQIQAGATNNLCYSTTKNISDKKYILNYRSDGSAYYFGWDRDLNRGKTFNTGSNNGDWYGDIFSVADLFSFGYRILSGAATYSTHDEFDIIYCNQVLTTTERDNVITYLNNKHNCYRDISFDLSFVLHGTSNAAGTSTTPPNRYNGVIAPKTYIRTGTNTFALMQHTVNIVTSGAEYAFGTSLADYFNRDIYLHKDGQGGSRFCVIDGTNFNPSLGPVSITWNTGVAAGLYPPLQTAYGELKTKMDTFGTNKRIYFVIGGENDAFYTGDANGFETNLNSVINTLESSVGTFDYFVIDLMRSDLAGTGPAPTRNSTFVETIRTALTTIANSKTNKVLLDMVNYSVAGDGVHFENTEQVKIGRDAFELLKNYIS